MPTFLLALDQGTTSSRAILFTPDGTLHAAAQKELRQIFPGPPGGGWVEHDPMDIWQTQLDTARQVIAQANIAASDIAAIGIANQRETTLLWDRATGLPLHNAIVWQDRRTADACAALRQSHATLIQQKTGLIPDAYFSASKLQWLLDHIPHARARAARGELAFGTVDSWLLYNLTHHSSLISHHSVHATDPSNASRTMLFNIHTCQWDDELLALFNIPREVLPEVRDSAGLFGTTSLLGPGPEIPITGIAGDQQAALFGQSCLAPGMAKNTYGTGCFLLMNTGATAPTSKHRLLSTIAWRLPADSFEFQVSSFKRPARSQLETRNLKLETSDSKLETRNSKLVYALEGSVFVAGALVQWLRDGLGIIHSADDIEPLARSVPDSAGIYIVPAFAGLGAPHWDPYARGTILGITRSTTKAHFARAALEAIAFQVADLLDAMHADLPDTPITQLRTDGGAARNGLLLQFQADLLQRPVLRPAITETTALGAALLAGVGGRLWSAPEAVAGLQRASIEYLPSISQQQATERRQRWAEALARAKEWDH